MNNIFTIAKKEFKSYFSTPMGYTVVGVLAGAFGYMFFQLLFYWYTMSRQAGMMGMGGGREQSLSEGVVKPLYGNVQIIVLFALPFITMRLLSEERKMKTMELLVAAPITLWEIVIGKWLSGVLFHGVLMLAAFAGPMALIIAGKPDLGILFMCNLYTLLLGSAIVAAGLFFSSLTENQIVAGLCTVALSLFLIILPWAAYNTSGIWADIVKGLSILDYYNNMSKGVLDLSSLAYFGGFIFIFLFMTQRSLWSKTMA